MNSLAQLYKLQELASSFGMELRRDAANAYTLRDFHSAYYIYNGNLDKIEGYLDCLADVRREKEEDAWTSR